MLWQSRHRNNISTNNLLPGQQKKQNGGRNFGEKKDSLISLLHCATSVEFEIEMSSQTYDDRGHRSRDRRGGGRIRDEQGGGIAKIVSSKECYIPFFLHRGFLVCILITLFACFSQLVTQDSAVCDYNKSYKISLQKTKKKEQDRREFYTKQEQQMRKEKTEKQN